VPSGLVIMIPTANRPVSLIACLASVMSQEAHPQVPLSEIIISDSSDPEVFAANTMEIQSLNRKHSEVRVTHIRNDTPGFGSSRNSLLDAMPSNCAFFVFIDDDEVAMDDLWLRKLVDKAIETRADIVGGAVLITPTLESRFVRDSGLLGMHIASQLDELATNNLLVSAKSWRKSGLRFSEKLNLVSGEDTDWIERLVEAGLTWTFEEAAIVTEPLVVERSSRSYQVLRSRRSGRSVVIRRPGRESWHRSAARIVHGGLLALKGRATQDARVELAGLRRLGRGLGVAEQLWQQAPARVVTNELRLRVEAYTKRTK
jgi:GT2 family glycosyltransferase